MRNYIILNGKNSNEINGLLIQELPPISKPLIRTEVEEIDGRDGDIVTPLGYSAYDKELTIGLYKDFDVNEVAAYFNSEGTVIFSNEPDKYYYYQITAEIDFERLVRYRTATVTMHCQPFKYSATEQPITEDVSGTVSDEGTNLALENTAEAPFNTLDLKGNTEQDDTPTPDAPVAVQTVTGENVVKICGKNLFDGETINAWLRPNGTEVNSNGDRTSANYIAVLPNTTYTLHGTLSTYLKFTQFDSSKTAVSQQTTTSAATLTATTGATTAYIRIGWGNAASASDVMLELGSTATAYEPYQGQSYEVNLGKNLCDGVNQNYWLNGAANSAGSSSGNTGLAIPVLPNTDYSVSTKTTQTRYRAAFVDSLPTSGSSVTAYNGVARDGQDTSFTRNSATHRYLIINATNLSDIQVELGSTPTSYAAYFEPIELCKIGTYQDYIYKSGGKWYVHKAVGKYTFNGTESWTKVAMQYADGYFTTISDMETAGSSTAIEYPIYSPYFISQNPSVNWSTPVGGSSMSRTSNAKIVRCSKGEAKDTGDVATWKAWVGSVGLSFYYPLATPTDTEITNEALIEQLDDIYYHAHAYKGRTHITSSAATGNVPHIIAAEVGEDNESTITNAGNYLSKPKITVYGSGDISLYINDMHVLQITLGDEGYITIDTAQMEAYKDTLDNLKNRLVIGDYSNARLKPGANKIHFTGTVTKYIVENYSRWL